MEESWSENQVFSAMFSEFCNLMEYSKIASVLNSLFWGKIKGQIDSVQHTLLCIIMIFNFVKKNVSSKFSRNAALNL